MLKAIFRILIISVLVWILVVVGLVLQIQAYGEQDRAEPAETIIVLGSGLRRDGRPGDALYRRAAWAAELYEQGYAPNVICTGGVGDGQRRSEADACREVLVANGVPFEAVYLEDRSRSTEENAIFSQEIMQANGWQNALLVTDSFHMLRANWIFESIGIEHSRSPVSRDWVRDYYYNRHLNREILALHWQLIKEVLNLPHTYVG